MNRKPLSNFLISYLAANEFSYIDPDALKKCVVVVLLSRALNGA